MEEQKTLQQRMEKVLSETVDEAIRETFGVDDMHTLSGYVLITEWAHFDGQKSFHLLQMENQASWTTKGLLYEAVDEVDAEQASSEEDE